MNLFELILTGDHATLWSHLASGKHTQSNELNLYLPVLLLKAHHQALCQDERVLSMLHSQPASQIILTLLECDFVPNPAATTVGDIFDREVGTRFEYGSPEVKLQLTMDTLRAFMNGSSAGGRPLELLEDPYLRYGASLCLWVILSRPNEAKIPIIHKVLGVLPTDIVMTVVRNSPALYVSCVGAAALAQNRALLVELSQLVPPWSLCRVRDELSRRKALPDLVVNLSTQLGDLVLFLNAQRKSSWLSGFLRSDDVCAAPGSNISLWALCAASWETQFSPNQIHQVITDGPNTFPLETICFILGCANLMERAKPNELSECIRHLADSKHGAVLLLTSLRFSVRKDIEKVVEYLEEVLGVKVRLDTSSFNATGQFITDVLPLSDVSRLALSNGNKSCILELLQNRMFQRHKIPVRDTICETLASLTLPVSDVECTLLEQFCSSCTVNIGYIQPMFAEQQLLELSDSSASVATRCGLLYVILLHNKNVFHSQRSQTPAYATKWIDRLPAKLLLLHALSLKIIGGLPHKLLGLVVTFLPNAVAADDLPIHRNPLLPGPSKIPLRDLVEQPALDEFLSQLPSMEKAEEFSCLWEQLYYQFPVRVLGPTVAALTHPHLSVDQLQKDPLLLIKRALPSIYASPFIVRILTRLYHAAIGASRRALSESDQVDLKLAQDVGAVRSLIGVLHRYPNIPVQSQHYICDTIHQIFLDTPEALRIVHLQGYDRSVVPILCQFCPSMHLCMELVPAIFVRGDKAFSLTLGAHLSSKYPTRRSETLCANVVHSLSVALGESPHEHRQLLVDVRPALELMGQSFPLLREMVSQINPE